jgi:hypothetical protein
MKARQEGTLLSTQMIRSGDSSRGYFTRSNCRWKEGMRADHRFWGQSLNVRFGSKADIRPKKRDVRFTPKSGHQEALLGCPLCAISRRFAYLDGRSSTHPSA